MNYFGTSLTSAGHYFWTLDGEYMESSKIYFKDIPFNPEEMPTARTKGSVEYYHIEGYTICAIAGSCKDTRWGTRSVFWINEDIEFGELLERIKSIPIAQKILAQMPFEINF